MMNLIVSVLLLLVPVSCLADNLEIDLYPRNGGKAIQALVQRPITPKVGVFGYGFVSHSWSEAYAGLTWNPTKCVEGAYGVGKESTPGSWRTGGWLWAGKGKASVLYCFEDGTSGSWHRTEVKYQFVTKTAVGFTEKTYKGRGIFLEQKISSGKSLRVTTYPGNPEIAMKLSF